MPDGGDMERSAELLRRWRQDDDAEALHELLQIEVRVLKQTLRGRGAGGATSTSDIAQQAVLGFLAAERPPDLDDPRRLRGYLWRSAWHLLVKRFERASKRPERIDFERCERADETWSAVGGLRDIDRAERAAAIELALNVLSREDRSLIRAVYFENADIAAAGAALGLSREAANSRLVRARRLLAGRLADWSSLIG